MWIWRRPECSISLHNQGFYTLARPSSYVRKSAHLKGQQFHCRSLILCNCVSFSNFIRFYFCCPNFTIKIYEQKWGHYRERKETQISPHLIRSRPAAPIHLHHQSGTHSQYDPFSPTPPSCNYSCISASSSWKLNLQCACFGHCNMFPAESVIAVVASAILTVIFVASSPSPCPK